MTQPKGQSREEKIQALHELIASAKRRDVSGVMVQVSDALLVFEKIEHLQQERDEYRSVADKFAADVKDGHERWLKAQSEVSQLREEREKLKQAIRRIAEQTEDEITAEYCRALGIGVDNETP